MKICACGCGRPLIAKKQDALFIWGHNARRFPVKTSERIPCGCGCGTIIDSVDDKGRVRRFKQSHSTARTHGMAGSSEHNTWSGMLARCRNPNDTAYERYGGREIRVCERWLKFGAFYADMGPRPEGLTLERIDNNKGYEPGNCKWATRLDQARNRRSVIMITHNGETKNVSDWAKSIGVSKMTVHRRLNAGWPFDLILATPGGTNSASVKVSRRMREERRKTETVSV